ncbi:MAG: M1 family aminopeptidase, partial [Acidobacteriota bacterium]
MKCEKASAARLLFGLTMAMAGCQSPSGPPPESGVAWELAEERQRTISDLRYEIQLTIPESHLEPIRGWVNIRFQLSDPSLGLVIDFKPAADRTRGVRVADQPVGYQTPKGHIVVAASDLRQGENSVRVEFQAGDSSLNRNPEYLYTLFVPDRASSAIPCFDQPNLKARWSLTLQTPPSWQAVSNGALIGHEIARDGATFRFAETEPISTYLFSFAAGKFQVETAERDGRPMRMLHRETDAAKVERNREAIFDLHRKALEWLEEYSGIPYPFQKFDFVLIPSFQYGGMEHPGAIQYNAARLLLDESAT